MAKIKVTNPKQIINGGAKKYYFKVKGVGGIKGDKGDKGDTGSQGPQGPQGNAATIMVGSTTTLPTGYDATVTNTGTINNAILNFGIPRGIKGDAGAKGDKGDKGDKGEQGNTGPQGPAGQNATVYIGTTTTGAPGTQASVYNSGTDRNAVLNFTIPQGATGATGATGPQGPAGQDGQNFTPTIVETLPTTGDQSKLYLTPKAHTTQTATGNPITATVAEDAGAIESFQLDGDTFQQSYTGKNLFDTANADIREQYILNDSGVEVSDRTGGYTRNYSKVEPSTGYILSGLGTIGGKTRRVYYYDENKGFISRSAQITTGSPTLTFTTPANCYFVNIQIFYPDDLDTSSWQLEAGSSATSFEPYTGGQPSPSPSYPQQIQTVTGEQTVEIVGKNLFDKDNMDIRNGYLYSTTFSYRTTNADRTFIVPCEPNTTYTISRSVITSSFRAAYIDLEPSEIPADASSETSLTCAGYIANNSGTSITITTSATAKSLLVHYGNTNTDGVTLIDQSVATIMVEKSASATAYAPYSKQTFTLDLGDIELNGLGDDGAGGFLYKDRIYRDGNDWKIHKATGSRTFDGSEQWTYDSVRAPRIYLSENALNNLGIHPVIPSWYGAQPIGKLTKFTAKTFLDFYTNGQGDGFAMSTVGRNIQVGDNRWTSMDDALAATIGARWYYAQATGYETDTVITDTTLIAQLEAIRTALLQNGANTISNTATGSNLAGDMEIGYYGYNPTNRYDKFIWLDINNEYEQIGS